MTGQTITFTSTSNDLNRHIFDVLMQRLNLASRVPTHIPAQTVLLPSGQRSSNVYCLVKGQVDIALYPQNANGARVVPLSFGPGMVLLIHTLYDESTDPGEMAAAVNSEVHVIPHAEFKRVMHTDVETLELVTRFLASRLSDARRREQQWIARSVQERVSALLKRLARENKTTTGPTPMPITLKVTHEHLAERSGVSRAKVSKELKRLERDGVIALNRNSMQILRVDRLD